MTKSIQQAQQLGQSIWYDNIRRALLTSGELKRLVEDGVVGVTSNPSIFEKAIVGSTDYDSALRTLAQEGNELDAIYETLVLDDIATTADLLRPVYGRTDGRDGYVSVEVRPTLAHDTDGTISEARRLFHALARPNVMIKVPATPEGIPAIEALIAEGINVNVTLIFSIESYGAVADAYLRGLEKRAANGGDLRHVASVASFFVSRVDTAVDRQLDALIRGGKKDLQSLLGQAAMANSKLAYARFKEIFNSQRFATLQAQGARVQRPLWASTGTKNPQYRDVVYVEGLIGADTVNTVPPATLTAFNDHGQVAATLETGLAEAKRTLAQLADVGIDLATITRDLQAEGVQAFVESFDKLLANLDDKRARLLANAHTHTANLGTTHADVDATLVDLQRRAVVRRIWAKDHTVWKSDPREITNRLGWLTVADTLHEHADELIAFTDEIRRAGFKDVVLLGMGGSSLAPEVFRVTFGKRRGYPRLHVLDSTIPAWVRRVTQAIDPAHTLFIVSSKSGGTLEVRSFFKYFYALVAKNKRKRAGENFIAITDPNTSLQQLAESYHFRRVFINPPDIGGRYSALSYFGIVPAALAGVDIHTLLQRGECMAESCAECVPAHENPGAWLGAVLGAFAKARRDKVTFITSPRIATFGLWAEQLIAESTGKEGKGILPIAQEPFASAKEYDADRVFAYLRLDGDDNRASDRHVVALEKAGQPVIRVTLRDRYDLGAEFFRWEFATAIAGALIGIHPFDQPNVQESKDYTAAVLNGARAKSMIPPTPNTGTLADLLAQAHSGDYVALMAYVNGTPQVDAALNDLRSVLLKQYRLPNTLGYGPRFLHSTGQLHKGGANKGLFVQLTADGGETLPVPDEGYSFAQLAASQVVGDYASLLNHERRVVRIHLGRNSVHEIRQLIAELKSARTRRGRR
ncbi:MAG: bifunctional transaldolase/phosoglucose isomerase [Chloroflexi bacterium]|nr:bifunctional transaldolase/phosoglucose isomerase [Chloroflexota bacterium]